MAHLAFALSSAARSARASVSSCCASERRQRLSVSRHAACAHAMSRWVCDWGVWLIAFLSFVTWQGHPAVMPRAPSPPTLCQGRIGPGVPARSSASK